jgi:hypothetical protein
MAALSISPSGKPQAAVWPEWDKVTRRLMHRLCNLL